VRSKGDVREMVLLAALLVFVAGLCLQPVTESDLFFRLKVGQEILARHALLGRNLFSFTAPDHPDLDLGWAFEVAVALLHKVGGFPAVVVGKTIWIVATFAGGFAICRRLGAGPIASAIALAAAALVMRDRLVERPHIVSYAGEIVVLAALSRLDRPWSWRRVLGFALAMVLWANAHAGLFAAALMLVLAGIGGLLADRWTSRLAGRSTGPSIDRSAAMRALSLGVVVVAAACATPVGPLGIVRYLLLHLTLPRLHAIDEFRNATWRSDGPFFVWLLVVGVVVVLTRGVPPGGRGAANEERATALAPAFPQAFPSSLPELLPAFGMTILGLASVRFSADVALVTAPLLAMRLSALFRLNIGRWRWRRLEAAAMPVATVALLVAAAWPRVREARAGRPVWDVEIDSSALPLAALRFVEDNGLREHMYNDFEFGSYLLFQGYPRYRVFVDPRLPAYPEDMHRLLGLFHPDRATWDRAMTLYGVDTALLGYAGINRRVAWWDPEGWALVYRASDARVFVRRREKWRAFIAAHEIPATFDFTVEQGTTTQPIEPKPALSPVTDCEWQRRVGDLLFDLDQGIPTRARAHYEQALAVPECLAPKEEALLAGWMGALELGAGEWGPAAQHLDRALALSPNDTRTRANRATVFERVGRRADAAADWKRVAAEARGTPLANAADARARSLDP
jgi:hypothetical protein